MDELNGDKPVPVLVKRCVLVMSVLVVGTVYLLLGNYDKVILFNSAILSPVFWSWIAKPIINKLGIDYKSYN